MELMFLNKLMLIREACQESVIFGMYAVDVMIY